VRLDVTGFNGGFIFTASFPYTLIPRDMWDERMRTLAYAGVNCLTLYLPGDASGNMENAVFYDGEIDPVFAFAAKHGLGIIIKVAPGRDEILARIKRYEYHGGPAGGKIIDIGNIENDGSPPIDDSPGGQLRRLLTGGKLFELGPGSLVSLFGEADSVRIAEIRLLRIFVGLLREGFFYGEPLARTAFSVSGGSASLDAFELSGGGTVVAYENSQESAGLTFYDGLGGFPQKPVSLSPGQSGIVIRNLPLLGFGLYAALEYSTAILIGYKNVSGVIHLFLAAGDRGAECELCIAADDIKILGGNMSYQAIPEHKEVILTFTGESCAKLEINGVKAKIASLSRENAATMLGVNKWGIISCATIDTAIPEVISAGFVAAADGGGTSVSLPWKAEKNGDSVNFRLSTDMFKPGTSYKAMITARNATVTASFNGGPSVTLTFPESGRQVAAYLPATLFSDEGNIFTLQAVSGAGGTIDDVRFISVEDKFLL